jgi:amino acid adenylation domain-containing protein
MSNPYQPLSELPYLTEAERQQLLIEWNNTKMDYSKDTCIHELFEAQVEKTPNATALVFEEKRMTYRELNLRANQVAHYLQALGVGPEVLVGVCMERSLEMVIGLLGILKAGGAYVPLDPEHPKKRLAFILEDAQVAVLLTQQRLVTGLPEHAARVVCLDVEYDAIATECAENLASGVTADHLAYVIYTSGSTGRPKGAMNIHRGISNRLLWMQDAYQLTRADRVLQKTPFSFDVSVWEFFWPLTVGAWLIVARPGGHQDSGYLVNLIAEQQITALHFVPSILRLFLEEQRLETCNCLKHVICSGETLPFELQERFFARLDAALHNLYGPTEASVDVTSWACKRGSNPGIVPIGRPIANTQIYILDSHLNPVPIGSAGELHIGGVGLARGYLNRPHLTAEKFIPNPFSDEPGARLYKTGDQARYRPDGNIEFLNRFDDQVKIRGFRVELGEVEAALCQHPAVREAVVMATEDATHDPSAPLRIGKRLVAYLIPEQCQAPTISELRHFLREKLPETMVPSAVVMLDALPLTMNGKVDRRALSVPDQTRPELSELAGAHAEARTVTECLLARIWAEVLGIARIGANDDFFALGGHSLKATLVIARVLDMFGVELSHRCFFEAPTLSALAERIDRSQPQLANVRPPLIETGDSDPTPPLSCGQTEIWLTTQLDPSLTVYNEAFTVYMNGPVDPLALEKALNAIIRRHEILRTAFIIEGVQPIQIIQDEVRLILSLADLGSLPESDRESQTLQMVTAEARRPFKLAEPPLLRATLVRTNETDCRLYLTVHHIVVDAYSIYNVLIPELWQLYESFRARKPSPLRELRMQYADYARWQRQHLPGAELKKCLTYWKNQLDGAVPLELPTARPRPPVRTFRGAYQSFALSKELTDALNTLSRQENVTLYMMLLAAFKTLLWRYAQQDEIVVGTAEAGRNRPEFEQLLGYFLNTLVLRSHMADDPTFQHFLQRVREVTLAAYAHRNLPFAKLVEELQPKRDPSRHPLFQIAFVMEPTMLVHESGWTVSQFDVQTGTSKFDLTLELEERSKGIIGRFEYNTDLFDGETIRRMIGHLQALLEGIVATPQQRISDLPLLTQAERHQQLVQWNDTNRDYPRQKCVHQLFEAQVELMPDAVAVVFERQRLTYWELNRRANQLARYLNGLGVGPEVLVGICVERSLEMVIGLLGILKAGGAYVPLDPAYPKERLTFMLEDSQARLLLAQKRLVEKLIEDGRPTMPTMKDGDSRFSITDPRIKLVCLDADWEVIAQESEENPVSGVTANNLAYAIYTSGSTGRPKGVLVEHGGLCNLAEAQVQSFDLRPDNRILQFSSLSFDASIFEIVMALRVGSTLCLGTRDSLLPGPALIRLLRDQTVTNITIPPSSLATLPIEGLPSLRTIIVAGEPCSADLVARWASGHRFFNAFGPTEATVWATVAECVDVGRKPPIGRPIANTQIYLLDAHLQPVPIGVSGEVHIGGAGLARGYLNRTDLTAEKFIPNPFSEEPGARLYKTGDLACYLPDGNIEFLGRIDHQVKIRGFRIELGEIESVLGQHPGVREAVVLAREDDENPKSKTCTEPGRSIENLKSDKRLVAYVVPRREPAPTINELRSFLKEKLPEYMVPSAFVFLDPLPLTPNGKIDRKRLPALDQNRPEPEESYVAPRTPVEELLAEIWAEVLKLDKVGIHDNFFDLGGHSLLATQVISRVRNTFQVEVAVRSLFEMPTVAGLADAIEEARLRYGESLTPKISSVPRQLRRVQSSLQESLTGPKN